MPTRATTRTPWSLRSPTNEMPRVTACRKSPFSGCLQGWVLTHPHIRRRAVLSLCRTFSKAARNGQDRSLQTSRKCAIILLLQCFIANLGLQQGFLYILLFLFTVSGGIQHFFCRTSRVLFPFFQLADTLLCGKRILFSATVFNCKKIIIKVYVLN